MSNVFDFDMTLASIRKRLEQKQDYETRSSDEMFFGGADVIIDEESQPHHEPFLANQPIVFDSSGYAARRRVVVTRHATRLSELFYQFRDSGFDEIDSGTKYLFYGALAQAALDFLERNGDPDDPFPMLLDVYKAGERILRALRDDYEAPTD